MLFKSGIITAASGSLGGLTASHNRGGQYLRARVIPTNPSSGPQVAIRAIFGSLATAWQTLTDDQRAAWTTYAINVPVINRLGDPINLTGQQMYIRNNTAAVQVGLPRVDDGPTIFASDALSPVTLLPVETNNLIGVEFDTTDEWANEAGGALLVYASRQKAATVNFFKGPYRFAGTVDGADPVPPTSPATNITNVFEQSLLNVMFGRVLSVRVDGRISPVQFIGPNLIP